MPARLESGRVPKGAVPTGRRRKRKPKVVHVPSKYPGRKPEFGPSRSRVKAEVKERKHARWGVSRKPPPEVRGVLKRSKPDGKGNLIVPRKKDRQLLREYGRVMQQAWVNQRAAQRIAELERMRPSETESQSPLEAAGEALVKPRVKIPVGPWARKMPGAPKSIGVSAVDVATLYPAAKAAALIARSVRVARAARAARPTKAIVRAESKAAKARRAELKKLVGRQPRARPLPTRAPGGIKATRLRAGGVALGAATVTGTAEQRKQRSNVAKALATAPWHVATAQTTPEATVKSLQATLTGLPPGLVFAAQHPVKAVEMMKDDIVRRYGPLVAGDTEKFRRIARKEGLTPYILDLMSVAPASQVIGRAGRLGLIGPQFQRWMTRNRPNLRVGGRSKVQPVSRGVFGRGGQYALDLARARRATTRPHPVRPGPGEVVPFSSRGHNIRIQMQEARRTGRYGIAQKRIEKRVYKVLNKLYPGLSKLEKFALKEATVLGISNADNARLLLTERIAAIEEARATKKGGVPAKADELPWLRQAIEQADELFTPEMSGRADELRRVFKRLAAGDPSLGKGDRLPEVKEQAVARAYAPLAALLERLRPEPGPSPVSPTPSPPFAGYGGRAGPGPETAPSAPRATIPDLDPDDVVEQGAARVVVKGDAARKKLEDAGWRVTGRDHHDPFEAIRKAEEERLRFEGLSLEEIEAMDARGELETPGATKADQRDTFTMEPSPVPRIDYDNYARGTNREPIGVTWEPGRVQRGILYSDGNVHTWDPGGLIHDTMERKIAQARLHNAESLPDPDPTYEGPRAHLDIGGNGTIYARLQMDDPTPENVAMVKAQIEKKFAEKGHDVAVADVTDWQWNEVRDPIHKLDEFERRTLRDTEFAGGAAGRKQSFGHGREVLDATERVARERALDAPLDPGIVEELLRIHRERRAARRYGQDTTPEPEAREGTFRYDDGDWETRQAEGRTQDWEANENIWDEMEGEQARWEEADTRTFGRSTAEEVPGHKKAAPREPLTFAEVEAMRKKLGLRTPGYLPSQLQPGLRPLAGRGGVLGMAPGKKYTGALRELGLEDFGERTVSAGVRANIARRFEWARASEMIEEQALDWAPAGGTLGDILRAVPDGVDVNDIDVIHVSRMRGADANPAEIRDILQQVVYRPAQVPEEYANRVGWVAVPKAVTEQIISEMEDMGRWGRLNAVLKSKSSRVILGVANVPWLQFQVASNLALTTLAGVGPASIVRAQVWWKKLDRTMRDAVEPDLGQGHFTQDVSRPRLLREESNRLVNEWRAFREYTRVGRGIQKTNIMDAFFALDRQQNLVFRRAVLHNRVRRDAYNRIRESAGRMEEAQARVMGLLGKDPKKVMDDVLKDPTAMRRHAEAVDEFLGNYVAFTKAERWLSHNVMFYAFLRFSLRFTFYTMPVKHPIMTAIMGKLSELDPQEVEKMLGPGMLPYNLGRFYFEDGKMMVDLSRANPALSGLSGGNTVAQRASSLFPPYWTMIATQVLRTVPYTAKRLKLQSDPYEIQPIESFGGEDRLRVFGRQVLTLYYPYRTWERIEAGGEPIGDDHLVFSPRYVKYVDPTVTQKIAGTTERIQKESTGGRVLREVIPFIPRRSEDELIAEGRFEQLRQIKKRRRNRGASRGGTATPWTAPSTQGLPWQPTGGAGAAPWEKK